MQSLVNPFSGFYSSISITEEKCTFKTKLLFPDMQLSLFLVTTGLNSSTDWTTELDCYRSNDKLYFMNFTKVIVDPETENLIVGGKYVLMSPKQ